MRPSRRTVLRGAGIALGLPWLESLAPRAARGAAPAPRRTFIAFTFPNGVADFWRPAATGKGAAWTLSPILEPLTPLKKRVSVLANVGNYGPFHGHIEPSHGNLNAAFLTCAKPTRTPLSQANDVSVGISVDQVIAQSLAGHTRMGSLQVGLSTLDSSTDGLPGSCSRSISWASANEPLYKLVNPQKVFDRIVADGPYPSAPVGGIDIYSAARRSSQKSVLDYVASHAATTRAKLGRSDQARLDDYLSSVRELEKRVDAGDLGAVCGVVARPTETYEVGQVPSGYDRDHHADLMVDLALMAVQCDVTRVVSFMGDDARSDFVYDFLRERTFTATGSAVSPSGAKCGNLHGASSSGSKDNGWATINRWFVEKLARLCTKLDAIHEGGATMLDNATVWFGSEMHGGNHDGLDLPVLYVGSGGGRLETDMFFDFKETARGAEGLGNVYLTFIRRVFDRAESSFGDGMTEVNEILV